MGMRTKNIKPKKSGGKRKTRKSNTKFRKTRSKKQKGSGATCSRLGQCNTDQNNIEDQNSKDDHLRYVIEEKNEGSTIRLPPDYKFTGVNPYDDLKQPSNMSDAVFKEMIYLRSQFSKSKFSKFQYSFSK